MTCPAADDFEPTGEGRPSRRIEEGKDKEREKEKRRTQVTWWERRKGKGGLKH